jgi:hypothetical protein
LLCCAGYTSLTNEYLSDRFWPKADIQYLIIEAVPNSLDERPLMTQSEHGGSFRVAVL